ncbi:hypothetical protein PSEUBRA_006292 [Kalmanozyma brasiliensis GHG001]|uniref:Uncharacterized protein n=1 Tax=Kalmanozyma brasiliensis (strain GHG001) TaxID=1365824 RepID=V5GEW9_KALBG|nr:uncharacterized protein PSEUBRA_006292 [Kalmanozyma brasiliensis GHG001]EST04547.1 hypothetical protein PSEUBRA_006292 [Kalmanozyma brasiliensis GHG001]
MGRPRSSFLPGRARTQARKRTARVDSFLVKHYTLFNSLARYAEDGPSALPESPRNQASASIRQAALRARRLAHVNKDRPGGGSSNYTWPLPFPQLPAYSQEPKEHLNELVDQIVKETFEADYAKFRSWRWASQHRISKKHLEQIIVDPTEVEESAVAAKALVETVLGRFVSAVEKGEIGASKAFAKRSSTSTESLGSASAADAGQQEVGGVTAASADTPLDADPDLDDEELDEEIWGDDRSAMNWTELLDYLQTTAGTSKTSQWRNWHLLDAIAKTRQRCEELFGREDS